MCQMLSDIIQFGLVSSKELALGVSKVVSIIDCTIFDRGATWKELFKSALRQLFSCNREKHVFHFISANSH